MSRSPRQLVPLGIAIASIGLLAACGQNEPERQIRFNVGDDTLTASSKSGQTVIKTGDGIVATADGDGPVALPQGLDVYPGATVTTHMTMDIDPTHRSYVVAATTPDSINQVLDHYRALAKAQGYTISTDRMDSASSTIAADKGETGFSVLVRPDAPNTNFQLSSHGPLK